ncbi:MAG: hypothetical protein HYS66_19525 [Deltaproteobacteria bacterium]|nr:hypothetical protein [Deltaproteobacteria bacterium]
MQDADIQQRFHLMQREFEAAVSFMREAKIDLTAAIDSLKIEIEILKTYMERYHPGFAESGTLSPRICGIVSEAQGRGDTGDRSRMDGVARRAEAVKTG